MSIRRIDTIALGLLKKEEEELEERRRMPNRDFFTLSRCISKLALYSYFIHSFDWKSAVEHDGGV